MGRYIYKTFQWDVPLRSHWDAIFSSHMADCCSGAIMGALLEATFGSRIATCCSGVTLGATFKSHIAGCCSGATIEAIFGSYTWEPWWLQWWLECGPAIWLPNVAPKCDSAAAMWLLILLPILLRCSSQQCGFQIWLLIMLPLLLRCSSQQCGF